MFTHVSNDESMNIEPTDETKGPSYKKVLVLFNKRINICIWKPLIIQDLT